MAILEAEVDSDGGEVGFLEGLFCEAAEEGGLAHWAVADENYLEEVVVLLYHIINLFQ